MTDLDRIRAAYDRLAPTWDRTAGLGERILLGDLRRRFGGLLEGSVLEVAIGSGLNLPHYGPAVSRRTGCDLSRGMLDVARRRAGELGIAIDLVQADAQALPFRDAAFDTVAISLALCTVPDPEAALRELARVCRPGGTVVLLEHVASPAAPVLALQRLLTPLQERAIGCHLDRPTLDTARSLGYRIVAEESRLFGVFRLGVAEGGGRKEKGEDGR